MSAPARVQRAVVLSDDERYRYLLLREWGTGPTVTFVMLNPSTADAERDDPTVRRCIGYAHAWGCGALAVVNLYAYRATRPADLWAADDPVGPLNDGHLVAGAHLAEDSGGPLLAAWGALARADRIAEVLALPGMSRAQALATTASGQPRHPLYLRGDLTPQPWVPDARAGVTA